MGEKHPDPTLNLKTQLFDIDLKLKRGIRDGTILGAETDHVEATAA